jgi:hypothetical protein
MRAIVIVEVLPFLAFVIEELGDALELAVELLGVDAVTAFDADRVVPAPERAVRAPSGRGTQG